MSLPLCLLPWQSVQVGLALGPRTHSKLGAEELALPLHSFLDLVPRHASVPSTAHRSLTANLSHAPEADRWRLSLNWRLVGRWRVGADSPSAGSSISYSPHPFCLPTAVQFPPHPRGPGDDRFSLPQIQALLSSCMLGKTRPHRESRGGGGTGLMCYPLADCRPLQGLPFSDWKGSSTSTPRGRKCCHTRNGSLSLIRENHRIPE